MILDEKKRSVPAKFGPWRATPFAALLIAAAAAKTIHQPCGQRNEHASPQTGFDVVAISGWRRAGFCSAGALPIFATAADAGARCSHKLLM
jgi:hypothetical protein